MRAISRADLVSSPSDAVFEVSVVRSLNSAAPRLTVLRVVACSSMVRVAISFLRGAQSILVLRPMKSSKKRIVDAGTIRGSLIAQTLLNLGWGTSPRRSRSRGRPLIDIARLELKHPPVIYGM